MSSNNDTKALSLCDNHVSLIFITRPLNHLLSNKQLIDFLHNEMKSLGSIFSWCNRVNILVSRKDQLALSHGENRFDRIFVTLA